MKIAEPQILYEDEDVIVCRKEAGVAVQTARSGQADLVSILKNYRAGKDEDPYIGVVHRLDQPVEGVMVFAKTRKAAADLSGQARGRLLEKQYLAVVEGRMEPSRGELLDYLLRDGRNNTSAVVPKDTPGAKEARLSYEALKTDAAGCSLVRIALHTGRHHQIRVQFSHAGHPVYADAKYGGTLPDGGYCPLALCSCKIGFRHPATGKEMAFEIQPKGKGFSGM